MARNQLKKNLIHFSQIHQLLTLDGVCAKDGRRVIESDLSLISNAALLVEEDRIVWVGSEKSIPSDFRKRVRKIVSLKGKTVLPAFVECHTHSVFAGSRAAEFELRNSGVSYTEIAKKGGGILSTVKSVRAASGAELLKSTEVRLKEFLRQGVTTVEIKSGYGLDLKSEVKTLEVIKKLKTTRVISTFLGAHAKPPEFTNFESYLQFLWEEVAPVLIRKKLTRRVDIFIEKGFFESEIARGYLEKFKKAGFEITIHADQLSLSGGSDLAIQLGAVSADHVICIDDKIIQKFAKSNVTAVLLPAADLYMKCPYPPARKLIDAGARVALATDFNPGTSPTQDLALVGLLARLEMKMTLPEVIAAYTFNAAKALKQDEHLGSLSVGKLADFSVFPEEWDQLFYHAGAMRPELVYKAGRACFQ